jgi:hypothetical protein
VISLSIQKHGFHALQLFLRLLRPHGTEKPKHPTAKFHHLFLLYFHRFFSAVCLTTEIAIFRVQFRIHTAYITATTSEQIIGEKYIRNGENLPWRSVFFCRGNEFQHSFLRSTALDASVRKTE